MLSHAKMTQEQLDEFYASTPIDIYFNLCRSSAINGWPLGGEALMHGALLFSTDALGLNERDDIGFGDEFTKIELPDPATGSNQTTSHDFPSGYVLSRLHRYVIDRALLLEHAIRTQNRMKSIVDPQVYSELTFGYIEANFRKVNGHRGQLQEGITPDAPQAEDPTHLRPRVAEREDARQMDQGAGRSVEQSGLRDAHTLETSSNRSSAVLMTCASKLAAKGDAAKGKKSLPLWCWA